MQIILLERIGKLGQMGDVVTVKDGFARNYLLPHGKALRATPANMERFERERAQLEARNLELKSEAEGVDDKLSGETFVVIRQAGDTGQLYGSVTTRDIAQIITDGGFSVTRSQVLLDRPIKTLGVHPVRLGLHPEVETEVTVNVARTEDEAERQARGEDVTAMVDEDDEDREEETLAAEEVFEDEALARDAEEALTDEPEDAEAASDETAGVDEAEAPEAAEPSEDADEEKR